MLVDQYKSDLFRRASFRKYCQLPFPHRGHWEKCKDGMPSDAIEGEPSHLGVNSIFSPSMPTLEVSPKPISQPILDPNDPSYTLSPKSHNDPRNPRTQPNHRSRENHMDNKQELW
jgi:hypothetical protein